MATTSEDALAGEPERTMYEYRMAWEGEREEDIDLGDALIHYLPVRWFGVNGLVVRQRYDLDSVDRRLDEMLAEEAREDRRYLWVVGPSSYPSNLGDRFKARGYGAAVEWDGMILTDLAQEVRGGPDVVVEPLSAENAEGFARVRSEGFDEPALYQERLASARRYLAMPDHHGVHIHVAILAGEVVGYVILRAEPGGPAYFRDAYTLERVRRRGVYLALVRRRLEIAREAGCRYGVVQANRQTSSPTLQKRGWRPVSLLTAYSRPDPTSSGW
jgi:GNAT superfamily N-acetyltransferase